LFTGRGPYYAKTYSVGHLNKYLILCFLEKCKKINKGREEGTGREGGRERCESSVAFLFN